MRKITIEAVHAFYEFKKSKKGNTRVDIYEKPMAYGTHRVAWLSLFGNNIAKLDGDELTITTAGWNTVTTRGRLNGLRGVRVSTKKGILYLNGKEWDGGWVKIEKA